MSTERLSLSSSLIKSTIITLIIISSAHLSLSSVGDRLQYYNKCFSQCRQRNCSRSDDIETFDAYQPRYLLWMGWNCREECRYQCQWRTVTHLIHTGNQLPQFYGKVSELFFEINFYLIEIVSLSGHSFAGMVWKSRRLSSSRC